MSQALPTMRILKITKKHSSVVVLDNIRSGHNVGAAFRIADAFLIDKLYLCGITAHPPHREIHKTALGAENHIKWEKVQDTLCLIKTLKKQGYCIVGIEQTTNSKPLNTFQFKRKGKYAIIFGHEVFGVQASVLSTCDICLEIPQYGIKRSLNVSVSIGIALWELVLKNHYI